MGAGPVSFRPPLALCLVATLVACTETHLAQEAGLQATLDYTPPSQGTNAPVDLGAGDLRQAVAEVSEKLSAAGYRLQSADREAGVIRAVSNSPALVDCGTIIQTVGSVATPVAGNATRAVLFNQDLPGSLARREVSMETSTIVQIVEGASITAQIGEVHNLTLSVSSVADGRPVQRETKAFAGNATARFSDGTECTSSDAIRAIID